MSIINERHIDCDRAGDTQGGGNYETLTDYLNGKIVRTAPYSENTLAVTSAQFALIDDSIITGNLAIGITSIRTDGGISCAALVGSVGTAATTAILDPVGATTNLVEVRDAVTHDALVDTANRRIFGLLQSDVSATDGDAVGAAASENIQISFVVIASDGTYTLTTVNGSVEIAFALLFARRHEHTYHKAGIMAEQDIIAPPPAAAASGIFATDVSNDGSGLVGSKLYLAGTVPVNRVITEAMTDDDSAEVHFMVEGGIAYSPTVTVDGITCTNLAQYGDDQRLFYGSVPVVVAGTRTIDIVSSTGSSTSVLINRAAAGPEINNMEFVNGYPGGQTEVKGGDTFDVEFSFNPAGTEPTEVHLQNSGAGISQTISLAGSGLNWGTVHSGTVTITIDSTSTTVQALAAFANAENSFGTVGNTFNTNDGGGNVNGTNLVNCNDVVPSFADNGTTFPASQAAFKGVESGSQDTTVNNYTGVTYSSPHGDFTVANTTTYEQDKGITCTNPGDYNDSSTNFRIVAVRATNGTSATFNKTIEVADVAPLVSVSQPQSRLRSGPSGEDYTITASSNQNLAAAPDLDVAVSGVWQGGSFAGGAKVWTRTIRITDGDAVGTAAWGWNTIAPVNNAGTSATITGNEVVGGFVSRALILAAFATTTVLDTRVVDTAKLTLTWSFKPGMVFQAIGTPPPVVSGWTIDALDIDPTEVEILDTSAANASSQASTITIEEGV